MSDRIDHQWAEDAVEEQLFDGWYTETNEDGNLFPLGAKFVYPSSTIAKKMHSVPPWGYGCTAFKLGPCEATLTKLIDSPSLFAETLAAVVERPMFAGRICRGFRVQIGVEQRDDVPLSATDEAPRLAMAVWAHDATKCPVLPIAPITLGEMASLSSLADAAQAATRLRMQVARATLDELGFLIPRGLATKDITTIAYHLDAPSFSMVHRPPLGNDRGANVTCYLGATPLHAGGSGAAVYYSGTSGSCFYPPPESGPSQRSGGVNRTALTTVPASTGIRVAKASNSGRPSLPHQALSVSVLPFWDGGRARHFLSTDAEESGRLNPRGDNGALAAADGISMRLRTIATVVGSPMSTRNGKLYGHVAVDSIESTLLHTDPRASTICFTNTPEWVTMLTAAATRGRVWELLNEETAITDIDGVVTHYDIDREKLQTCMRAVK